MVNNDIYDMYNEQKSKIETDVKKPQDVKIKTTGILTEMTIAGKKITIVDPDQYVKLAVAVKDLQTRAKLSEARIRLLQGEIQRKDQQLNQLRQEIQTKVGYDDNHR